MPPIRVAGCLLLSALWLTTACNSDPRVAAKNYVQHGNQYFNSGKYKEASLLYRRALKKDARCAEAWYQLGLANNQLGIYVDARKDFARAMDLDPANVAAIVKLGDLDLLFYAADQHGNKELLVDLKDLVHRLLRRDTQSYDGLRFSGEIALIERDLPRAIQSFDEANRVKPYQRDLVLALAQSLETAGQDERARRLALELIEHNKSAGGIYDFLYTNYLRKREPEAAEEILNRKIANNPTEGAYLVQLAFHYYMTSRPADVSATLARLTAKPNAFPDARLQAGDFFVRIHEFDRALAQYDLGEKENRKNRRVYRKKMVEVLATQGKTDQAAELLDELSRDDRSDPEVIGLHASLLLASGNRSNLKRAIGDLEQLARKTQGSAVLHYNLGRAYLASGREALDRARAQFTEALRIDPKHLPARLGLAEAELARGDSGEAVTEASRVMSAEPSNTAARLLRARALANTHDYGRARADLDVVLGMDPKSANARLELGELDLKERRFDEAETQFQALIAQGDSRGVLGAIKTRVEQGQFEPAIQIAEEQLQKTPQTDAYRSILANLLLRAGKYAEAAVQFQTLIDRNPNAEEFYMRLGDARAQLNDIRGAMTAFEKARELAPADATADVDLGILFDRSRNFNAARKAYESALRKQPDNSTALNNLAYLEAEQGVDLDQALAYAQRARAKRPDDVNVIDTLGLIYVKKNLTEDGLRMLREVVKQQPANATFRLHLAMAWYQKGDRLMARRELEAARRSKPNDAERGAIQELSALVG